MDVNVQQFLTKSLKSLQSQITGLEKTIKGLEKRIRSLEPQQPDEMVLKTADGKLDLYLIRDEETGQYVDGRVVVDDAPSD